MKSIIYQTTKCTFERVVKLQFWDDIQRTLRWCSKNIKRIKKSKNQNIKEHHLRIEVLRLFQKCILWSDKWYFRSQITSLITLRTWKGPWVSASGCNTNSVYPEDVILCTYMTCKNKVNKNPVATFVFKYSLDSSQNSTDSTKLTQSMLG